MQNLIGENGQQRRRAPQQHGEQIQGDCCQDHFFAEHESHAGNQTSPRAFLNLISRLSAPANRQNKKEKGKCTNCVQDIDEREADVRNQQSADARADNRSNLKNAVVPGDRVRERIAGNQRRKK